MLFNLPNTTTLLDLDARANSIETYFDSTTERKKFKNETATINAISKRQQQQLQQPPPIIIAASAEYNAAPKRRLTITHSDNQNAAYSDFISAALLYVSTIIHIGTQLISKQISNSCFLFTHEKENMIV